MPNIAETADWILNRGTSEN